MIKEILPPTLLVTSLLLFIAAFATLAVERPQPSMELHRARLADNEEHTERLEAQLAQSRLQRTALITGLFGMAVITAAGGYLVMRPSAG